MEEVKETASALARAIWDLFMEGIANLDDAVQTALDMENEPSVD